MTPMLDHADYPELSVLVTDVLEQYRAKLDPADVAALRAGELDVDRTSVAYTEDGSWAVVLGRLSTGRWIRAGATYDEGDDLEACNVHVGPDRASVLDEANGETKRLLGVSG